MKKILLLSLISTLMLSCNLKSDPKENLKEVAEKMLKTNLNDPSSYEFVSFEIDTTEIQVARQRLTDLKTILPKSTSEIQTEIINDQIQTLKSKYDFESKNITYSLKYRAKNKFGALVLGNSKVTSDKDFNMLNLEEN